MLMAKNISKIFKTPQKYFLLKDINFELKKGQSIAIMGKSGVGKTTLLHILATLDNPSSGSLYLFDKKIKSDDFSKIRKNNFGFIFQSYNLIDDFTVIENILLPYKIDRKNTKKNSYIYKRAEKALKDVGLEGKENLQAKILSGGEKQRAAIARAICKKTDIIFADEPTGNLDQENSKKIQNLLLKLVKNENNSLLIVTHDIEFAKLCDKTYHLKNGILQ